MGELWGGRERTGGRKGSRQWIVFTSAKDVTATGAAVRGIVNTARKVHYSNDVLTICHTVALRAYDDNHSYNNFAPALGTAHITAKHRDPHCDCEYN